MKLPTLFRKKPAPVVIEAPSSIPAVKRSFAGAQMTARYSDFTSSSLSANGELEMALPILRARSRYLERNNPHVVRYLQLMQDNVVGHGGFQLQVRAKQTFTDQLDKIGNDAIEADFKRWAKVATSDGMMTLREACRMVVRTWCRDGEVIIQKRRNRKFKFGFALKFIEADQLDETLNERFPGTKNRIRMGVEIDDDDRPIAYHILTDHPGDSVWSYGTKRYVRVPADEIIHVFVKSRAGQTRGQPPMAAIMNDAKMLGGYREAEITNRRLAAAKGGFFEQATEAGPVSGIADSTGPNGEFEMSIEPGKLSALPPGWKFNAFDAAGSATDYAGFEKQIIKSLAAGLGPSYCDLAQDLTEVSYSSIRQGALADRDFYRGMQEFVKERFLEPVYADVLDAIYDFGSTGLPWNSYTKFLEASTFRPRGWSWIDPASEIKAAVQAREGRMSSLTQQLAEQGVDFEDTATQIADEDKMLDALGIPVVSKNTVAPVTENV
jgi:lambda family phage portal protein